MATKAPVKAPVKTPAKPPAPKPPVKPTAPAPLTQTQQDAYTQLQNIFNGYGLGTLTGKILQFVRDGQDVDSIQINLQQTDEWKKRFKGNELRRKNGLSLYTPAEYLHVEDAYRTTLKAYGLQKPGYYDSHDDFADFIGNDVSPDEVKSRAQQAWNFAQSTNAVNRKMLRDYYSIDDSDIAAYFLDPTRGQPLIDQRAAAATYGGIAARQNLEVGRTKAESWYDQGITADAVSQGVQQAATILPDMQKLGSLYGENYTQTDALDETVTGLASARRKRERLAAKETATFGGGTGTASFGSNNTGGF